MTQRATADSIKMLNEANPTKQVLTLRSFETLVKMADGKATKLVIPSEIQALGGLSASLKEVVTSEQAAQ